MFTTSDLNEKVLESRAKNVAHAAPRRHPVRNAVTVLLSFLILLILYLCAVNPNFGWSVVGQYLFDPSVMHGIGVTLSLTVVSMLLGIVLGLICAVGKLSKLRFFMGLSDLYLWFFRSTPLLVQLLFWYNLSALFPVLGIPGLFAVDTNDVITPLTAAVVGLSLNEGAYMAEIIRAGLMSVDPAQRETAEAFGMSKSQILFRVLLPQAMRAIVPPTGNQVISMIKATAMVSIIAMEDLLYSVQAILWYLVITSVLTFIQSRIERKFAKGERGFVAAQA